MHFFHGFEHLVVLAGYQHIAQPQDLAGVRGADEGFLESHTGYFRTHARLGGELKPMDSGVTEACGIGILLQEASGDAAHAALQEHFQGAQAALDGALHCSIGTLEAKFLPGKQSLGGTTYAPGQAVLQFILCTVCIQKQIGQGCGGLNGSVRHQIGNVHVSVVADGGDNRDRAGGDGYGQIRIVEARQIQVTAAAAED